MDSTDLQPLLPYKHRQGSPLSLVQVVMSQVPIRLAHPLRKAVRKHHDPSQGAEVQKHELAKVLSQNLFGRQPQIPVSADLVILRSSDPLTD